MRYLKCSEVGLSLFFVFFLTTWAPGPASCEGDRPPNFVIIFADDLGYGDLGCYGHPTLRTPNLDRMAAEGMRFTDFYSAAPVCTPSRAALMTGRLPVRSGMCSDTRRVLFPDSAGGIPESEITLAEGLKQKGYTTGCVGKWHLGHLPQYLPTRNGFDFYFGIPYSNDMDHLDSGPSGEARSLNPKVENFNVPLMRNEEIVQRPADQTHLTQRYTEEAIGFIKKNKEKPFFLYMPHTFPHIPLFASEDFLGKSPRGLYGDAVEEVDWSVGQVLDTLKNEGLAENTLVFFTSDNGPWLIMKETGGSAGLLRDGKGSTWEGGMREPGIAWWPGKVKGGELCRGMSSTMDLYTTCLTIAGAEIPTDRVIDGVDMSPLLFQTGPSNRDEYFYYRGQTLYAVRKGQFKAHYITRPAYGRGEVESHDPPVLYHLGIDPSESIEMNDRFPEVLKEIEKAKKAHLETVEEVESQLEKRIEP
ncbi:MAG: sulfatase [Candidatus Omnitrophica bacterium]|nr:sulfatase [Candidatus Omnitrophota bacterium]